jgi:hypothetical protein
MGDDDKPIHWRDAIDLAAHRALVEIRQRAESARRSLGQRIRYAREAVRRVTA